MDFNTRLNKVFDRVVKWNSARYPREYDESLTLALLAEEHQELQEAKSEVDKLDALCDLLYVACGALWKSGSDNITKPSYIPKNFNIKSPCTSILTKTVWISIHEMLAMGLYPEDVIAALNVVCDSNDSKIVSFTDKSVKANIDKGESFIPPEPRLTAILEGRVAWKI